MAPLLTLGKVIFDQIQNGRQQDTFKNQNPKLYRQNCFVIYHFVGIKPLNKNMFQNIWFDLRRRSYEAKTKLPP